MKKLVFLIALFLTYLSMSVLSLCSAMDSQDLAIPYSGIDEIPSLPHELTLPSCDINGTSFLATNQFVSFARVLIKGDLVYVDLIATTFKGVNDPFALRDKDDYTPAFIYLRLDGAIMYIRSFRNVVSIVLPYNPSFKKHVLDAAVLPIKPGALPFFIRKCFE